MAWFVLVVIAFDVDFYRLIVLVGMHGLVLDLLDLRICIDWIYRTGFDWIGLIGLIDCRRLT